MDKCCICLQTTANPINGTETDTNNASWISKLTSCVPDVDWPENCLLCGSCVEKLKLVCTFRDLCLKSASARAHAPQIKEEQPPVPECVYTDDSDSKTTVLTATAAVNPYECTECEKTFRKRTAYFNHLQAAHKVEKPCECGVCGKGFKRHSHLKRHELLHAERTKSQCYECNGWFDTDALLREHERAEHGAKAVEGDVRRRKGRPQARECVELSCEACPETFRLAGVFKEHVLGVHGLDSERMRGFKCEECEKRFRNKRAYVEHVHRHRNTKKNVCSYCGKVFTSGSGSKLKDHERVHKNLRSFRCALCGKGFNTSSYLRTHRLIKHGDPSKWPYQCATCDKRFLMKSNYESHVRRHVGDKPFACHLCEKRFVTKDELASHLVSHSNVRAFRCDECGKEYKDRWVMEMHLTRKHGIGDRKLPVRVAKLECAFCGKRFCDRSKLQRHVRTHTGEKPFGCGVCEKRFTDRSYLNQHLKKTHGVCDEND